MSKTLIPLDEYNERQRTAREEEARRDKARRMVQARVEAELGISPWNIRAQPSGIACPQCQEELIERGEGMGTALGPFEKFVDCPKCGFHGKKDCYPGGTQIGVWV